MNDERLIEDASPDACQRAKISPQIMKLVGRYTAGRQTIFSLFTFIYWPSKDMLPGLYLKRASPITVPLSGLETLRLIAAS
jgi:hypothetical protein